MKAPAFAPGVSTVAWSAEVALTWTKPPAFTPVPFASSEAVVERPFLTFAIVRPIAAPPTEALSVSAVMVLLPFAVTSTLPATGPRGAAPAWVVPVSVPNAIAPPMAARPTPTEMTWSSSVTSLEFAFALTAPTVPPPPTSTFPIVADVSPETLATATAAPTAIPATATPTAHGRTERVAEASTSTIVAFLILAPVSMWAIWSLESFRTTTCAPSVTSPAWPAKAIPIESSVELAMTFTAPPAVMSPLPPIDASPWPRRFATSTPPPMAATPAAIEPAMPKKPRLSRAMTLTLPPAVIVPLTSATVPSIGPLARAECVWPAGALSWIFWPTPSPVPPLPICAAIVLSVVLGPPVECG